MSAHSRRALSVLATAALSVAALAACSDDSPSVSAPAPASSTSSASSAGSTPAPSTSAPTTTQAPSTTSEPSASSPASSGVPGTTSDLVRLCGGAAVSSAKECTSDQPSVSGNVLYCSARLPSSATGAINATLYRNGSEVFKGNINVTNANSFVQVNYSVGKLALAGGTYSCKFTAGSQSWLGSTTVQGPQGRASQGMACDGDTMYTEQRVTHCTSNSPTLRSPGSVGCSGLVTDLLGKKVDAVLQTPQGAKRLTLSNSFNLGSAVVYLKAPKTAFAGSIPSGAYRCEFVVDGQNVLTVPFTVA